MGSHNIKNQTREQRVKTYRRAQAKSLGNEYSRLNAAKALQKDPSNAGLQRLATKRAPSQTALVEARQAKFSQQTVTAEFKVHNTGAISSNIGKMTTSMSEHGFDRRHGSMKGSIVAGNLISHDNRRLVSGKTADVWAPMKLEHPSIQNIDMSSLAARQRSATRKENTINDFLIKRTSPNRKAGPDKATLSRGHSVGFDSVKIRTKMEYENKGILKKQKRQAKKQAEDRLISRHPTISGRTD